MSDTIYKFKYPVCGFCHNFQWEADNTTSGQCSETHTEVAADGDVCSCFKAEYDEIVVFYHNYMRQFISEVDKHPKWNYKPYIDACGIDYFGLTLSL